MEISRTQLYLCRSRKSAVESVTAQFEEWKSDHVKAMRACDAEEWMQESIRASQITLEAFNMAFQGLRSNKLAGDPEEYAEVLARLFEATVNFADAVAEVVPLAKENGFFVENEVLFQKTRAELLKAKNAFTRHWPKRNQAVWKKSAEEIANGEFQFTEDILNEIQTGGSSGYGEEEYVLYARDCQHSIEE